MIYSVHLSHDAERDLKKMDRHQSRILVAWMEKNLDGCDNPRLHGKALVGDWKGFWSYRVGMYRLVADIHDDVVVIELIHISHRRDVYG